MPDFLFKKTKLRIFLKGEKAREEENEINDR